MGDAFYKNIHKFMALCVDCSRPAIPGHIRCEKHLYKRAISQKKYGAKNRANIIKKKRQLYIKRRNSGLCIRCGCVLSEEDGGNFTCCNCVKRLPLNPIKNSIKTRRFNDSN